MVEQNMADDLWFPPNNWWIVKLLRFINLLDDAENVLSPTKFNLWAANISARGTSIVGIFAWFGHNMNGMETVWAGAIGWLTHAHISYQARKKQTERTKVALQLGKPAEE